MNLLPILVRACPAFRQALVTSADHWLNEDGTVSDCAVMSELGGFVVARLRRAEYEDMAEIFRAAEELLGSGAPEAKDAVATCFLESLLNAGERGLDPASFVPLLGPASREYCRAWDAFTGVKTPGLW